MKQVIFYGSSVALNWAPGGGDAPIAVQLSPFGEFALHDGGKMDGSVQHCTVFTRSIL